MPGAAPKDLAQIIKAKKEREAAEAAAGGSAAAAGAGDAVSGSAPSSPTNDSSGISAPIIVGDNGRAPVDEPVETAENLVHGTFSYFSIVSITEFYCPSSGLDPYAIFACSLAATKAKVAGRKNRSPIKTVFQSPEVKRGKRVQRCV